MKILICPLDWGLGHATRCVPIALDLESKGHEVIFAADGHAFEFLKTRFPDSRLERFPGFEPHYQESGSLLMHMATQMPEFVSSIKREHLKTAKLIDLIEPDILISDNRYGVRNDSVFSVLITHQIRPIVPWMLRRLVNKLVMDHLLKFDLCFVPDLPGIPNLTGSLSHHEDIPDHVHYVGPLSRFQQNERNESYVYEYAALISGPEPQRSILENELIEKFKLSGKKSILLCGTPGLKNEKSIDAIEVLPHLLDQELQTVLQSSKTIIARAGYSTIMDLISLNRTGILIPTPGQTEQEYLASKLQSENLFTTQKQGELDLEVNLESFEKDVSSLAPKNQVLSLKIDQMIQAAKEGNRIYGNS